MTLLTIVDDAYGFSSRVYARQMDSVSCYARQWGLRHERLDPKTYPMCRGFSSFFFAKHCAVGEYLKTRGPSEWVLVLDADVIFSSLDRNILDFIQPGPDLMFYERSWNDEIVSGNYLVRNTEFSIRFLKEWSEYDSRQPAGFSSADNGALHAHLSRTLHRAEGVDPCTERYKTLNGTVHEIQKYFDWVLLCRAAIPTGDLELPHGMIRIYPKYRGFVVDGAYVSWKSHSLDFPAVFFHGVKNKNVLMNPQGETCWEIDAARV